MKWIENTNAIWFYFTTMLNSLDTRVTDLDMMQNLSGFLKPSKSQPFKWLNFLFDGVSPISVRAALTNETL